MRILSVVVAVACVAAMAGDVVLFENDLRFLRQLG